MKEKIERWVWTPDGMEPYRAHPLNVGGVFVTADDYAALATERDDLLERLKALKETA